MSAPSTVLVTGAYGFIGRAYCAHLARNGVPYVGAVRARRADETRGEIVGVGDLAEADWSAIFVRYPIDCIVHLAARSHRVVDEDPDPRAAYEKANVVATRHLLEQWQHPQMRSDDHRNAGGDTMRARPAAGPPLRFVFASTVKVHGDYTPPGVIWRESDLPAPKDEYAWSKVEAETLVNNAARLHAIDAVILRFPMVYGPGVKANFAALFNAVRRRRWLPLGAIRNQRSLLGLANACSAIDAARTHPSAPGQTFLVSDGDDVSTPELVRAIADALAVRARLVAVPPAMLQALMTFAFRRADAKRLLQSLAIDSDKIRRSLAWTPPSTLHEELERLVRSLRRASTA